MSRSNSRYEVEDDMSFSPASPLYARFHRLAAAERLQRREQPEDKNRAYFFEILMQPNEGNKMKVYKNVFGLYFKVSQACEYEMTFGVVSAVNPGGIADRNGVILGDIMCRINRRPLPLKMDSDMLNNQQYNQEHRMTILGNNPIRLLHNNDSNFVNFILSVEKRHRMTLLCDKALKANPYSFSALDFDVTDPETQEPIRISVIYGAWNDPLTPNAYLYTGDILTSINGIDLLDSRPANASIDTIVRQTGVPKVIKIEIIPTSVLRRYPTFPQMLEPPPQTRPPITIGRPSKLEERFNLEWGWPIQNPGASRMSRAESISNFSSMMAREDDFMLPGPSNAEYVREDASGSRGRDRRLSLSSAYEDLL